MIDIIFRKLKGVPKLLLQFFVNLVWIMFIARWQFILYEVIFDTFIFKKTITTITFKITNSFYEVINKIWQWNYHKSCPINEFYFVRYSYNTFITIFINNCKFLFFYWKWKSLVLFCIFPNIFKLFLKIIC